jgi:Tol biopolymer transport system component
MKTGKTIRVDIRSDGSETAKDIYGFGDSEEPSLSADGNVIAFESTDSLLTPQSDYGFFGDTDVYARNVKQGTTVRVSLKADGAEANGSNNQTNRYPAVSGNGKFVAFSADPEGALITGDTNNRWDVYVKNLATGAVGRVSVKSNGDESTDNSGVDAPPAISTDGQRVAFESYAPLAPSDTNSFRDIYIRDRKAKKTIRASITTKRKQVDGFSHQLPALSADGRWIAFSTQGKFTAGDSGVDFDVFERGPIR